jgi:hypothetical protein
MHRDDIMAMGGGGECDYVFPHNLLLLHIMLSKHDLLILLLVLNWCTLYLLNCNHVGYYDRITTRTDMCLIKSCL